MGPARGSLGPVSGLAGVGIPSASGLTPGLTEVGRVLAQADVFVKYGLVERAVDHLRRVFALDPRHRGARSGWPGCWRSSGGAARRPRSWPSSPPS